MKTYVRYSMAVLVGGLLLGLIGCGSSNSSCPSGETMTTNGCGTGSCSVPGTNQTGAIVGSTCYALSGSSVSSSYNCNMYPGYTLQAIPAPYNSYPQFAQSGGEGCCPSSINVQSNPYYAQYCTAATNGTYGYGTTSSCPAGEYPNGMGGCVI